MEKKIELTPLELKVLKLNVAREFYPMTATDEEFDALNRVIEKASLLEEELDAYDDVDGYLMAWFLKQFESQE